MNIYKRGNVCWYRFRWTLKLADGRREHYRINQTARTTDRREAKDFADEHWRALRKGEIHPKEKFPKPKPEEPKLATLSEFSQRFLKGVEARRPKSYNFYKNAVKRLLQFPKFSKIPIGEITIDSIDNYVSWRKQESLAPAPKGGKRRGKKPKAESIHAVNSDLRTLRRMLRLADEQGELTKAPKVHQLSGASMRDRAITRDEERRYLAAAESSPTLRDVAVLLIDLGLRPQSELFPLRWEHVYIETTQASFGYVFIADGKTKAAKRPVPLTRRTRDILLARKKAHSGSKYVFPGSGKKGHLMTVQHCHEWAIKRVQKADKASKREPLKSFELYLFRHSFGTRRAEAGMNKFALARLMGHSSPSVAERYYVHVPDRHVTAEHEEYLKYDEMMEAAEERAREEEKKLVESAEGITRYAEKRGSRLIQ